LPAPRLTILAIPPVIPRIRDELHMTEAQIGFLVALPVLTALGARLSRYPSRLAM